MCCGHVGAERVTSVGRAVDVHHRDVDPSEMKLGMEGQEGHQHPASDPERSGAPSGKVRGALEDARHPHSGG